MSERVKPSTGWLKFFKERSPNYESHVSSGFVLGLINKIVKLSPITLIEWGYGTGFISIAMANRGYRVQGYDIEPRLIEYAIEARRQCFVSGIGSVEFTASHSDLKPADVVFSQGLLEHFTDIEIIGLIKEQLNYANKYVVFSVPSAEYKTQDMGDERLMDVAQWEYILESAFGDNLIELYSYARKMHIIGVISKAREPKLKCPKPECGSEHISTTTCETDDYIFHCFDCGYKWGYEE